MAIDWDLLTDTADTQPPICLFYGGPKLGKTTLASEFPNPLYVRTADGERQSAGVPMKSFGVSESYRDVRDQAEWMLEAEHDRRTLVIDALDGLETYIRAEACMRNGWPDIEAPGYGKGFSAEQAIWLEFIALLLKLKKAGFFVVLISHVKVKTEPGILSDSFPRYRLNLRDDAATAITSASDLIGFIHQRISVKTEELGFKKEANRGESSGEVLIAVQERPGYVAGNRYQIPKQALPFKQGQGFTELAKYFPVTE